LNISVERPIIIGESYAQKAFPELLDVVLYCPGKKLAEISLELIFEILKSPTTKKKQTKKIEMQYTFLDNSINQ